ncbi:hypothetical protein ACS0TY_023953 [Phlomoides rotata]
MEDDNAQTRANFLLVVTFMIIFSIGAQAACGRHLRYHILHLSPLVGVISGMADTDGNFGSKLTQFLFFSSSTYSTVTGWIMIMACTLPAPAATSRGTLGMGIFGGINAFMVDFNS